MTSKIQTMLFGVLLLGAACGAPNELETGALEQAATVTLRGTVSDPDTACNATVTPSDFVLAPGDTGLIELTMPYGWQIPGWQCSTGLCRKTFVGTEDYVQERIMLTRANDAAHTSAAYIAVAPSPPIYDYEGHFTCIRVDGKRKCWITWKPVCCTCPCDAGPGCPVVPPR